MGYVRRAGLLAAILVAALATQLGAGVGAASAATTCKQYDRWQLDGGAVSANRRVCAAPASDFPRYEGWGRVVRSYPGDICGFQILPPDYDDPVPAIACVAMLPEPVQTWRWAGTRWVNGGGLQPGRQAYFAPYAAGWRWAWTADTGWVAIAEQHAAFRWFA